MMRFVFCSDIDNAIGSYAPFGQLAGRAAEIGHPTPLPKGFRGDGRR